jgi:hypothetical protein
MAEEQTQNNIDSRFYEIKGLEWRPILLFKPMVVRELYETIVSLKQELSVINEPTLLRDQALLDLHVAKAHLSKNRNQAEFMMHIANALMDAGAILEWLYKTKNLRKTQKGGK